MTSASNNEQTGWLLCFYSVPARPVNNRMKLWRKMSRVGAAPLKGAVYILPASDEHEEFFEWLVAEVKALGGDGAFVRCQQIETMTENEVRQLFIEQRDGEYRSLARDLAGLEQKVESIAKGSSGKGAALLASALAKHNKEFHEIAKRDFFTSPLGLEQGKRLTALTAAIKKLDKGQGLKKISLSVQRPADYQGRLWLTRKKPFVDRMASAWLIRRFIDQQATFGFIDEEEIKEIPPTAVTYDIRDGKFTHQGDLCTFEVLARVFGVKDRIVRRLAEIVHDLDLKDDRYASPEASGVEEILGGIRKTAPNDADALERGMAVFEMLYRSKT